MHPTSLELVRSATRALLTVCRGVDWLKGDCSNLRSSASEDSVDRVWTSPHIGAAIRTATVVTYQCSLLCEQTTQANRGYPESSSSSNSSSSSDGLESVAIALANPSSLLEGIKHSSTGHHVVSGSSSSSSSWVGTMEPMPFLGLLQQRTVGCSVRAAPLHVDNSLLRYFVGGPCSFAQESALSLALLTASPADAFDGLSLNRTLNAVEKLLKHESIFSRERGALEINEAAAQTSTIKRDTANS